MGGFHGGHHSGGHHSGGFHGGHSEGNKAQIRDSGGHSSFSSVKHTNGHLTKPYHEEKNDNLMDFTEGFILGRLSGRHQSGGFQRRHSSFSSVKRTNVQLTRPYLVNDRTHFLPDYDKKNGKPMTFTGGIIFSLIFMFISLICICICLRVPTTATITKTQIVNSSDKYEIYDFEYSYCGHTFYGYGDDDLSKEWDSNTGIYVYVPTVKIGENYTLYVSPFYPATYDFDSGSNFGTAIFSIFLILGIACLASSIMNKNKFNTVLKEVGDANHDGKIDEHDLEYADSLNKGKTQGAYDGARKAEAENVYNDLTTTYCIYCGSKINKSSAFCQNCGGKVSK